MPLQIARLFVHSTSCAANVTEVASTLAVHAISIDSRANAICMVFTAAVARLVDVCIDRTTALVVVGDGRRSLNGGEPVMGCGWTGR